MDPEELREEIRRVRRMTGRPFAVNIPVRSPRAEALVRVVVEEKVRVISTSAGDPFRFAKQLKQAGASSSTWFPPWRTR